MAIKKVVFMGTPDFAVPCLSMLVEEGYEVQAVVSQPDRPKGRGQKLTPSPVKEAALAFGLPVFTPERIKEASFVEMLTKLAPDLIVVVAFGQFLPKVLLELPPYGCINVHASLLPQYRGAAPIHWAIINGEQKTGITTMFMDIGMDTGDMILKAEVPIGPMDTTGLLHDVLKDTGAGVLAETIRQLSAGIAPRTPQAAAFATYAPLLTRETEKIDWNKPAQQIHNLVRGLNPWPGAYCRHYGRGLKIWQTNIAAGPDEELAPGQAIYQDGRMLVGTGQGILELIEVQPESKRRMSGGEYIRGCGIKELEPLL